MSLYRSAQLRTQSCSLADKLRPGMPMHLSKHSDAACLHNSSVLEHAYVLRGISNQSSAAVNSMPSLVHLKCGVGSAPDSVQTSLVALHQLQCNLQCACGYNAMHALHAQ